MSDMGTWAIVLSVMGSSAGVAWAVRSKLAEIQTSLATHVELTAEKLGALDKRVASLETWKKRGR